jgi:hypothetical protein
VAKIRTGFVSNSSSTMFIVEIDSAEGKRYLESLKQYGFSNVLWGGERYPSAWYRNTEHVLQELENFEENYGKHYSDTSPYGKVIATLQYEYPKVNKVMVMVSDEDYESLLPSPPKELVLTEVEWH